MSLHYLIDGYNLIYALRNIPAGSLEAKRESLLRLLAGSKPHGKNRITVVFDSREGGGSRSTLAGLEVIYTAGETADDWLAKRVRAVSNAREVVVVSNDKGIRDMIRGTGARWMKTEDFWRQTKTRPAGPSDTRPAIDTDAITDEFKKKWL